MDQHNTNNPPNPQPEPSKPSPKIVTPNIESKKVIYKRGDIVLFDYGIAMQDSKIITKERPSLILKDNEEDPDYALILQDQQLLKYSGTVILLPITSTIPTQNYPFSVRIKHLTSKTHNLKDGTIKCNQIFTVDKVWISEVKGTLSARDLLFVDKALKNALGIPS